MTRDTFSCNRKTYFKLGDNTLLIELHFSGKLYLQNSNASSLADKNYDLIPSRAYGPISKQVAENIARSPPY